MVATLGLCMPTMYGNMFADPRETTAFIEYVEFYLMLGVPEINIYDSAMDRTTADFDKVLDYYKRQGKVFVYKQPPPTDSPIPDDSYFKWTKTTSRAAFNDCLFRNMYRYQFLFPADFDEFFYPNKHDNFQDAFCEWLNCSANPENMDQFVRSSVYAIHTYMSIQDGDTSKHDLLITSRFAKYVDGLTLWGINLKSILNPRYADTMWNHGPNGCPKRQKYCRPDSKKMKLKNSNDYFTFHHYRRMCGVGYKPTSDVKPSKLSECQGYVPLLKTDEKIIRFGDRLQKRVQQVLDLLNITPSVF
jgi:hypothetical protein